MGEPLRLALAQFGAELGDVEANLERMRAAAREAADGGAGLICFPELCLSGYLLARSDYTTELLDARARGERELAKESRELGLGIVYGTPLPGEGGRLRNAVVHQSPSGRRLVYVKTHLVTVEREAFTAGDEFVVSDGGIGLACCYDLAFPEAMRVIALRGARLLLVPMAWEVQRGFVMRHLAAGRAVENVAYVACVNQSGEVGPLRFLGRSCVVDPLGELVVDLAGDATLAFADIDLDFVARLRDGSDARTYPLYNDRRPELYRSILSPVSRAETMAH